LLTVAVTPGANPASTGITVIANLTPIGGLMMQPLFDDGTHGDANAGDNTFSFQATVANGTAPGMKSLAISIADAQSRTASASITLTVQGPPLAIHDIQGSGSTSLRVSEVVTTTGIVTGLKSNGFFIQAPETSADSDPNTSEGIFVFTSSAPPSAAAIGNAVTVTGTVAEFRPSSDPNSPPLTEISGMPVVTVVSTSNPLPAPITLTAAHANPSGSIEQLEKFEGMRVHVASLTVIAPTQGSMNEPNATSTSNGIFFAVITGVARPLREPGIELPDPLPAGAPATIPRFDANPERLRVDSDGQTGAAPLEVTAGAIITNIIGPLDYAARAYTILPDPATPPVVSGNISAASVPAPSATEFTVASFNMQRFFDTTDDPATSEPVLTTAAFNNRLNKASLAIRQVMRSPDIIGVEEVENLTTLQAIAGKINNDAVAAGEANPSYQAYLVEGNDPGGIDVGFLVKSSRVNVIDVTQVGKTDTYINPATGMPETLHDRPPLILRASIQPPTGAAFPITVIVNHLRSLLGIDDPAEGNRVRVKRRAQAEFLANLIQARQMADPNERIISIGDYNAFQFNDGYVDVIGTIKGSPAAPDAVVLSSNDLVNPNLIDLVELTPTAERYSYVFDGHAQVLDHVLVTENLLARASRIRYARHNADFPESLRNDAARPERISDHDAPVAYFTFPAAAVATVSAANYSGPQLAQESIVAAFGSALATTIQAADKLPLPTSLGGTSVKVRDSSGAELSAPLFFISPQQANYQIPPGIALGAATIIITSGNGSVSTGAVQIVTVAPGLFSADATGQGLAAALALRVKPGGAQSYEPVAQFDAGQGKFIPVPIDLDPATDQVFLVLFGTGIRFRSSLTAVTATIGGESATVQAAQAQSVFVGLDQVNVLLSRSLIGKKDVDVVLRVDGRTANTVRIHIK
jgi:uncharacterized protein (TIGR03437 family)